MKKIILTFVLTIISLTSFAQCASDYVGDFGVSICNNFDTTVSWIAQIKELSPTKIVIVHFAGIPFSMIQTDDTIVADLDCTNDSLTLTPITYILISNQVHLSYSGHGRMVQGALMINFHYTNPNGQYDDCVGYYNVTGIQDFNSSKNNIIVSPNPATNTLYFSEIPSDANAEIYDLNGKLMLKSSLVKSQIDVSDLAKGMYFMKISAKEGSVVRKFVKQ
jgi:hypothetical protein